MKNTCSFYIVFQVLKVLLMKICKLQPPDLAGKQHKNIETHRLLNKVLFSLCPSLCFATSAPCCLLQWQSFFIYWTQYSANFKCHKWSFVLYIVSFSGLKMVFPKSSQLDITACIKNCVYNNFNLHCYSMSSIIGCLYRSFSLINSSVQI